MRQCHLIAFAFPDTSFQMTAAFRLSKNVKQYESLSFSLVYVHSFESLDLIASRHEELEAWVVGLQRLVSGSHESQRLMQRGIEDIKVFNSSKKDTPRKPSPVVARLRRDQCCGVFNQVLCGVLPGVVGCLSSAWVELCWSVAATHRTVCMVRW